MRRIWMSLPLALAIGCAHNQSETKHAQNNTPPPAAPAPAPSTVAQSSKSSDDDATCGLVRVHFDLNSSQIAEGDKPLLERAAQCLKNDKGLHVQIEGNADERGTEEYNLALGDQRARSVAKYLEALGASGAQLKTVSYGKEQPECHEHDEDCWAKNRRAAVRPTSAR